MIANELSMNSEMVWTIITEELGMTKICAKMIPRLLTDEQKERRVEVTQLETDPNLLGRTITGDESWIFEYDPFTKWQSLEWKESNITKVKECEDVQVQSESESDVNRFSLMWGELRGASQSSRT